MEKKKNFIITIDTEGDNLWAWKEGDKIETKNVNYLSRFQQLCNRFKYKPVWLSNWEMINDPYFIEYMKDSLKKQECELGMHLHAWNSPPLFELKDIDVTKQPYLIEYPNKIMEEKIKTITERFEEIYDFRPISHRAGRWAMNTQYFKLLNKYGYKIDCSYTPLIDWSQSMGSSKNFYGPNYSKVDKNPTRIEGIFEIPVTTLRTHKLLFSEPRNLTYKDIVVQRLHEFWHLKTGKVIWLRPNGRNLQEMLYLADAVYKSESDYLMFMIHSSELMPGGSPTFRSKESIDMLYSDLEKLFDYISENYRGITLESYYREKMSEKKCR